MQLTRKQEKDIVEYLKTYRSEYSEETLNYIIDNYATALDKEDKTCELEQIYARFAMFSVNRNLYKFCLEKIMQNHSINSNILEIGGGCYPILTNYISKEQIKIKGGSVTVYDPKLVVDKMLTIQLKKQKFTLDKDISKYNLIVAVRPCEATEDIIKQTNKYQKELFLVLCKHKHFSDISSKYKKSNLSDWEEYVRELIYSDSKNFKIDEFRTPTKLGADYLMFSKKKIR